MRTAGWEQRTRIPRAPRGAGRRGQWSQGRGGSISRDSQRDVDGVRGSGEFPLL